MQKQDGRTRKGTVLNSGLELLKGGGIGGGVAVLILLICAGLISNGILKEQYGGGCVMASCVIGAFSGGLYAVRRLKTRPVPVGLAVGTILTLLLFTVGFIACGGLCDWSRGGETAAACLIGGTISGLFCCDSGKKCRK